MDAARPSTHAMEHAAQNDKKRLRKGTHSCWECKRRKRRCIFGQDRQTCMSCRRHGLPCLGQEVPEAELLARKGRSEISEQLSRVENILQNVMDKVSSEDRDKILFPPRSHPAKTAGAADARPLPRAGDVVPKTNAQIPTPAEALLAAFPCHEDYQTLMGATPVVEAIVAQFTTGEEADMLQLERGIRSSPPRPNAQVPFPDASTHPVLLARQMLCWVLFLQSPWHRRVFTFRENEWTIMERMAAAVRVVNGNDDLHGSLESLECMILEAQYHLHVGNLRRSWIVNRRAMLLAQLMCVHRAPCGSDGAIGNCARPPQSALDPRNVHRPDRMWSHILFQDRFLCMLLGLPQGSCDTSVVPCVPQPASSSKRHAAMQLECTLSGVAARILERNERGMASARLGPEYSTASLDAELLRAAQSCPPEFWDLPPFETMERYSLQDSAAVCQLLVQVFYFQLLNQLHLPYMLSFIHVGSSATASASASVNDYAAISCTRASREILQRFLAYRRFNHTTACFRQVDFCAVPAILTLLLAHLDVHLAARNHRLRNPAPGTAAGAEPSPSLAHRLIAHERSSDRALLKQVLERLDYVSHFNRDCMSGESAQLMRSLLAIEAKAAGEGDGEEAPMPENPLDGVGAMQIKITHLGLVYVSLDGRISKVYQTDPDNNDGVAAAGAGNATTPNSEPERSHWAKCIDHAPKGVFADDAAVSLPPLSSLPSAPAASEHFQGDLMPGLTPYLAPRNLLPGPPTMPVSGPMLGDPALGWGPAITAGTDNWATQGVDMAFFEHLFMDPLDQQR